MPDTGEVLAERRGAVLLLTLNRPAQLNAWTSRMLDRYVELLALAEDDEHVRAVVVTGSGRAFCAGTDVAAPFDTGTGDAACDPVGPPLAAPMRMGKPVIAAINGAAAGRGLAAALFTDIRFGSRDARFTTAFSRSSLAAEHGVAWLLPRLVGVGTALDLLLSARTLRGDEAGEIGLVDRVVASEGVLDAALAYGRMLASEWPPDALADVKHLVYSGLDSGLDVAACRDGVIGALDRSRHGSDALGSRHEPRSRRSDS